jgi:hypothetical protein
MSRILRDFSETELKVIASAKLIQRTQNYWNALDIFHEIFPDKKRYRCVETGISKAIQFLIKRKLVVRIDKKHCVIASYKLAKDDYL